MVTNYGEGGLQNGRGACEVLPLQKRGWKTFSHTEGRGTKGFGVVFMQKHSLKGGGSSKSFTLS